MNANTNHDGLHTTLELITATAATGNLFVDLSIGQIVLRFEDGELTSGRSSVRLDDPQELLSIVATSDFSGADVEFLPTASRGEEKLGGIQQVVLSQALAQISL